MASTALLGVLTLTIISFLILRFLFKKQPRQVLFTNWPFLGMIPDLLLDIYRIHDRTVEILDAINSTFLFKGPWLAGMDTLVTVDPDNIHYIMSSNFTNYTKGFEYKENFDGLGDGIFNAESDLWKNLNSFARNTIHHERFQRFSVATAISKLENGLVPVLDHVAEENMVVDLQDVFERFTSDTTFILVTGHDPRTLSIEMREFEFCKALEEAEEAIFYRFTKPRFLWKLENWFGIGEEKKMRRARDVLDRLCANYITAKREEIRLGNHPKEEAIDLLTSFMNLDPTRYNLLNPNDDKFLRDNILSLLIAGRDTVGSALTWFFWLLSKNPNVVTKIRQEIDKTLPRTATRDGNERYDLENLKKLVFLDGALYETLRLYPSVPFQTRSPNKPDVLPSGHRLEADSKILIPIYALGRMKSVWGEEATRFKPERWVSESGRSKHEPSYKFLSFNAGPRTCLGKNIAMTQMKIVAVEVLQNYDIDVVAFHGAAELAPSVILRMKQGLRVSVTKRSSSL